MEFWVLKTQMYFVCLCVILIFQLIHLIESPDREYTIFGVCVDSSVISLQWTYHNCMWKLVAYLFPSESVHQCSGSHLHSAHCWWLVNNWWWRQVTQILHSQSYSTVNWIRETVKQYCYIKTFCLINCLRHFTFFRHPH